jgi:hypothetical protein
MIIDKKIFTKVEKLEAITDERNNRRSMWPTSAPRLSPCTRNATSLINLWELHGIISPGLAIISRGIISLGQAFFNQQTVELLGISMRGSFSAPGRLLC